LKVKSYKVKSMRVERFEDSIAWQKSKELTKEIYKTFNQSSDFGFKNQIQRASVSIMNNIAEGFERQTNNELKQFLYIAKGSSSECRSMLNLALDLKYISKLNYKKLYDLSLEISKLLSGFIKTL
jgi:four helix bundle protein